MASLGQAVGQPSQRKEEKLGSEISRVEGASHGKTATDSQVEGTAMIRPQSSKVVNVLTKQQRLVGLKSRN